MATDEFAFETEIAAWLIEHGGYTASSPMHFDAARGLDTSELFTFIGATQAAQWNRLIRLHGGDQATAQRAFVERLVKELDSRGTVDVLRHGVVDHGVTIQLAYFRPALRLTPALVERYNANRLTVTRQLPYEATSAKTIDVALLVNGLPVATAEVKNPLTGQRVDNAKAQYRSDRDQVVTAYLPLIQGKAKVTWQEHYRSANCSAPIRKATTSNTKPRCGPAPEPARCTSRWRPPRSRRSPPSPTATTAAPC